MLFNSLEFAVFFAIVYGLYLSLNHRWQNRMLLAASYAFYGAWDWRFLSLILLSTVVDFFCGLKLHGSSDAGRRKLFLFLSVATNLSILGFFKYYDFFTGSLEGLAASFGLDLHPRVLNIIPPPLPKVIMRKRSA